MPLNIPRSFFPTQAQPSTPSLLIKREFGLVVSALFFLFFSLIMAAHYSSVSSLSTMRVVNPIAGIIPFIACLALPFIFYTKPNWVHRTFVSLVLVLTLFGNIGVFQNGPMTYAFGSSFLLLLSMFAVPPRFAWPAGMIAGSIPVVVIALSPVDSDVMITSRILITLMTLVWPLATLIQGSKPLKQLSWEAFQQLLISSLVFWGGWSLLGASDFTPALPQLAVIALAMFFITRIKDPSSYLYLLLSIVAVGMFLYALEANGSVAVFSLPMYLLALFLLLTPLLAMAIGALLLFSAAVTIDFLQAEFARSLISSVVFLAMLSLWFITLMKPVDGQHNTSRVQFKRALGNIGLSVFVSSIILLLVNLPFFLAGFSVEFNEVGIRWAVLELVTFTLLSWGIWTYLEQRSLHEDELIEARLQAEQSARKLQARQDKQSQIFSIIGHELRTPLASMNMMFNAMDIRSHKPYGEAIVDASQSVLSILDDLRIVMQPDLINQKSSERGKPSDIIERTLLSLSGLLNQHGLSLHFDVDEQSNRSVMLNTSSLRQVITNITKNAALHSEGRDVWVTCTTQIEAKDMLLRIRIEDNGRGIPQAKQSEMFQAFTRGDSDAEGTGLGLFIIGELLQLLQGTVTYFDSARGGAGFDILCRLPLSETAVSEDTNDMNDEQVARVLMGKRVLFAEDTPTLQLLTKGLLEKAGASVVACSNGSAALEVFEPHQFDLCLTDIMMPSMDGYQLAAELRLRGFEGPIIGLTAAVIGDESDRLRDAGADAVLSKPVDMNALKQTLFSLS